MFNFAKITIYISTELSISHLQIKILHKNIKYKSLKEMVTMTTNYTNVKTIKKAIKYWLFNICSETPLNKNPQDIETNQ